MTWLISYEDLNAIMYVYVCFMWHTVLYSHITSTILLHFKGCLWSMKQIFKYYVTKQETSNV